MINLDQRYDRQNFIDFLQESFLQDYVREVRPVATDGLSAIKKASSLGNSKGLDLQIFEFEYTGSANKRVTLTKEAFHIMKQSATFNALAVFYGGEDDWRFSFLTANPERTEKGKTTIAYSNPRRYSFFLGPNAKTNTPTRFLLSQGKIKDFEDLKSRFSIEVVNKEFYKEISKAFTKLVDGQLKLPFVQDKSQTSLEFAVRLIGRVIFCWFLREKKSEAGLALMPKELLSLEATSKYDDYYHAILEPIFFEVLNKPIKTRKDDFAKEPFSIVPYLNGGLFSPQDEDYYKRSNGDLQSQFHNTLVIPDSWFKDFFETLETYNFTIDENTSFDEELSIDPEMLGRIFENLLAEINPETGESARKSTGSYYTPRTIVNYMVDESLLLYLKEQTKVDEKKLRAIISYDLDDDAEYPVKPEEREKIIEALEKIKILDPACGSGAFPIGALQKIVFILQQVDPDGQMWFKKQIENTPPEVRRVIEREFSHKNFDYIRKLGIIRENIYGVDIQPIATEISRLRCFLTLVVDERIQDSAENRGIEPLPNLEFKFVTANSLIGLPTSSSANQMGLFEDDRGIRELKELRDAFFNATGVEREQLKLQFVQAQNRMFQRMIDEGRKGYADLTTKLSSWEPFTHKASLWFEPEWMFGIKSGFDVVIANPPYVGEKGHKEIFREIKKSKLGEFYRGKMDLFYFFFHLGLNSVSDNGVVSFITTNYYPTALGARRLRNDFKKRAVINELVNFNELKIFESAKGQHNMLTFLQKSSNENEVVRTSITTRKGTATSEILQQIVRGHDPETVYYQVKQNELYDGDENYIRMSGNSKNINDPKQAVLDKIASQSQNLSEFCSVNQGIVTGADKVSRKHITAFKVDSEVGDGIFVLSDDEIDTLNLTLNERQILRPWYKNSDVNRWYTSLKTNEKVIYSNSETVDNIDNFIGLKNHQFKYKQITSRYAYRWHDLHRSRNTKIFNGPKIVAPQRSSTNTFGYNENPWYAASDVFFITEKDKSLSLKYVLALLNSRLYYCWLYNRGKRKGEVLELIAKPLTEIPIKKISTEEQKPFIEVVDNILSVSKSEDFLNSQEKQDQVKGYERQIDQMVYELYGLSDEEIEIVEGKNE